MSRTCSICSVTVLDGEHHACLPPLGGGSLAPDAVNSPTHYKGQFPFEVIDLIKRELDLLDAIDGYHKGTRFQAYCLGNEINHRLTKEV